MMNMKVVLTLKSAVQLLFLINYLGRRWQEWKVKASLSSSLVLFSLLSLQRDAFNYIYRLLLGVLIFFYRWFWHRNKKISWLRSKNLRNRCMVFSKAT